MGEKLGDIKFEATFGVVASWEQVGDLANDPSLTNTFQVNFTKKTPGC